MFVERESPTSVDLGLREWCVPNRLRLFGSQEGPSLQKVYYPLPCELHRILLRPPRLIVNDRWFGVHR